MNEIQDIAFNIWKIAAIQNEQCYYITGWKKSQVFFNSRKSIFMDNSQNDIKWYFHIFILPYFVPFIQGFLEVSFYNFCVSFGESIKFGCHSHPIIEYYKAV